MKSFVFWQYIAWHVMPLLRACVNVFARKYSVSLMATVLSHHFRIKTKRRRCLPDVELKFYIFKLIRLRSKRSK